MDLLRYISVFLNLFTLRPNKFIRYHNQDQDHIKFLTYHDL